MKQLRALLFTALLLVSSLALSAQTTKYAAIIKALGQTELLDEDRRTQLATLLAQDSALSLPLELDLGAKLLAVSEHSLRLQTSPVGTAELRLLPLTSGQGPLTALIETVSSPQVDARISSSAQVAKPFRLRRSFAFPARRTSSAGSSSL